MPVPAGNVMAMRNNLNNNGGGGGYSKSSCRRLPRSQLVSRRSSATILNQVNSSSAQLCGGVAAAIAAALASYATALSSQVIMPLGGAKAAASTRNVASASASTSSPISSASSLGELLEVPPSSQHTHNRGKKSRNFVQAAAKRVGPAVVRLDTELNSPAQDRNRGAGNPPAFFSRGIQPWQYHASFDPDNRGQGSGFVWDARKGLVVTNNHVVAGASRVRVSFTNGARYDGTIVGADEAADLALVRITLEDSDGSAQRFKEDFVGARLPSVKLGDSNSLGVGDWVIAVGNPFGLDNTFTLGIISNLRRSSAEVGIPDKRVEFLQTDCAINPGNSGGPLLNAAGEVVGINTAIHADAEGIGFAIPINRALRVLNDLSEGRQPTHAWLGIQMVTLTPAMSREFNSLANASGVLPLTYGALVVSVAPNGPAARAGVRIGDVIAYADGAPVPTMARLQELVEEAPVGHPMRLTIFRYQFKPALWQRILGKPAIPPPVKSEEVEVLMGDLRDASSFW